MSNDDQQNPLTGVMDSLEDIIKWLGRIVTIALGVFLGLLLFMWVVGNQIHNGFQQSFSPAPYATTTPTP